MDDELFQLIEHLTELEHKNVELNSILLQDMINKGIQDIHKLDQVADRLMDSMLGITGAGEEMYRKYLDYIETFNPQEAKERKDDLEYELGYKTHVLYASAILCKKETEKLKLGPTDPYSIPSIKQYPTYYLHNGPGSFSASPFSFFSSHF